MTTFVGRPRELRWYHAAGFLFGDWGTSRLYVLGLAFVLSGASSFWYVAAMCLLVTLVGSLITFGAAAWVLALIGLIEGIIYLTKSDEDFAATYVHAKRAWF